MTIKGKLKTMKDMLETVGEKVAKEVLEPHDDILKPDDILAFIGSFECDDRINHYSFYRSLRTGEVINSMPYQSPEKDNVRLQFSYIISPLDENIMHGKEFQRYMTFYEQQTKQNITSNQQIYENLLEFQQTLKKKTKQKKIQ